MKKLIAMAVCLVLTTCVLAGCRRTENKKTTDTTTTPSTVTTPHTTSSMAPTSEATLPTTNSGTQDTPNVSSNPNDNNGGDIGGSTENGDTRSRAHYPSVNGSSR